VQSPSDFREHLRDELLRRCKKNPAYSLRAFAGAIGTHHALVSLVIRGKRRVTPAIVAKMGPGLGLSPAQIDRYATLAARRSESASSPARALNRLTLDAFHLVTEWYHDAILELSRVRGFKPTAQYVSRALGISGGEAQAAVERLERLGMIEVLPDGSWKEAGSYSTIEHPDFTAAALRAFQKKILALSAEAVNEVPVALRNHTCITVAMRRADLPEAKARITAFRRELLAFLQREGPAAPDDVYCAQFSLFPLTSFHQKVAQP
jgi:uncharacterized protein (TIGR02147 family)